MFAHRLSTASILLLITSLAVLHFGCARQSVVLDQSYNRSTDRVIDDSRCRFVVIDVQDIRKDRGSLGTLGLTDVSSEDVVNWLKNGLATMGLHEDVGVAPDKPGVEIKVALKFAHIKGSGIKHSIGLKADAESKV